jgi:hypothetical protein
MSTKQSTLGPRPAAHLISFAAECFEQVGSESVYTVTLAAPSYPKQFSTMAEAQAFARTVGRSVTTSDRQILRRIRWN